MAPSCSCSVVLVLALRLCVVPARVATLDDELRFHFDCATRCAAMTPSDREAIKAMYRAAGCDVGGPGAHPVCASSMEQLCVGSCGGGQQDMATFLPGAFGPGAAPVGSEPFSLALQVHRDCAERCASEGVAVSADSGAEKAVDTLRRCGVVQLLGAYDLTALDRFQKAFDQLKSKEKAYKKLLDTKQLHDGRYQVYLPFAKPFSSRETLGVSDLVLEVLHAYFMTSGGSFGIDHVSVLTSASGSANQSLHPDVHYFKGLSVSVHTALHDIPSSLGPTYFCPCTGESLTREDWPASAAIKMRQGCTCDPG
ncbi:Mlf [Symbiodinium sp. CCMP2456]|nr:Mlf [Symbiodinium sp. CCMP2456]